MNHLTRNLGNLKWNYLYSYKKTLWIHMITKFKHTDPSPNRNAGCMRLTPTWCCHLNKTSKVPETAMSNTNFNFGFFYDMLAECFILLGFKWSALQANEDDYIAPSMCTAQDSEYNVGQIPAANNLQSDKQHKETAGGGYWRNGKRVLGENVWLIDL